MRVAGANRRRQRRTGGAALPLYPGYYYWTSSMDVSSILSAPPRIFSLSERPLRRSRRSSVSSASSRWGLSLARSLFRSVPGSSDIPLRTLLKASLGSHSWSSHLWSRSGRFGNPATSFRGPWALRPRLATGLPFSILSRHCNPPETRHVCRASVSQVPGEAYFVKLPNDEVRRILLMSTTLQRLLQPAVKVSALGE